MPLVKSKSVNLEECILCQRKKRSEYLSSGDVGKGCIVSLAKQALSQDPRAVRVLQLAESEQGIMKYHASSCYRRFQKDMGKIISLALQPPSEPLQQAQDLAEIEQLEQSESQDLLMLMRNDAKDLSLMKLKVSAFSVEWNARLLGKKRFIHCIEFVRSQWP